MVSVGVVTHLNVDDLERCLEISADIAPAFEAQAQRWLDGSCGKALEPGVRERLSRLLTRRREAMATRDRMARGF